MFKLIRLFAVLSLGILLGACSKVPAGNVGVKVYLLGGEKGVEQEVLGVGRYWIGMNEELYLFPTFSQNYVWTRDPDETGNEDESISFGTKEGLSIVADVGITYNIQPDKVALVFQKYRRGVDEITDIYLRNMVRDALVKAASTKSIESIYGVGKADLIVEVEEAVRKQVSEIGINIERVYWVGDLRLPPQVTASINAKIQATQIAMQRENEIKTAEAQAAIEVTTAKGLADANIAKAHGEAESIRLKGEAEADAIKARAKALEANLNLVELTKAEKWNGQLPTTMLPNTTIPFLQK
jgi:regulator of protease activity HflC (stomatin/prohibitin superfamily)